MLLHSLVFTILSNAVSYKREKSILFSRIAIIILLLSTSLIIKSFLMMEEGIGLFGGLLHTTTVTHVFHAFIFLISAVILLITAFYPRKMYKHNDHDVRHYTQYTNWIKLVVTRIQQIEFDVVEYPLIILFVVTGALFLVSASDLVSIFLAIELQSYGLYLLSTVHRNSERSTFAGLTYFLLGSLSSCFILLGTSLLYTNSGTTYLDGIYVITSISDVLTTSECSGDINMINWYKPYYINYALLVLSVGFLFKISAAPFHFWSPDVYDMIPTVVTTFVAIIAKISIFIFLLEIVYFTSYFFVSGFNWTISLLISSLLSLIVGSIGGLTQHRIKRIFAYSTISHVGFILLALAINSIESIQAFIFYLMQYSMSNLNAFFILLGIGYLLFNSSEDTNRKLLEEKYSPIQIVSQLKGLFQKNPILSLSLAITMFSFMGIPPLLGFFAKQMVLSAALDNGYVFLTLVGILTSVISAVYYLYIVSMMFYFKSKNIYNYHEIEGQGQTDREYSLFEYNKITEVRVVLSGAIGITISVLTLIILLFIFMPQQWLSIANILALLIFKT